jgi:hypothetical protein
VEERRTTIRRESDRQLVAQVGQASEVVAKEKTKQQQRALRHAIRHTCKALLEIEFSYQSGDDETWTTTRQEVQGRVLDLSNDGAAFFIRQAATTNQLCGFRIDLYDGTTITGQAEIRWVKQQKSAKGYSVGAQFQRIDNVNADRIKHFLAELDATLGTAAKLEG